MYVRPRPAVKLRCGPAGSLRADTSCHIGPQSCLVDRKRTEVADKPMEHQIHIPQPLPRSNSVTSGPAGGAPILVLVE
jgi:hypothetical protein